MRRHDLVFLSSQSWRAALDSRSDLASDRLVASWAAKGWPLIARRFLPGERCGVALGLPLPHFAGKRRLSFRMESKDIVATSLPPSLNSTREAAPRSWIPTLDRLAEIASEHSVEARVFGSLAWRALTGLEYLSEASDLDLLWHVRSDTDLDQLTADLAVIEAMAPMRLDGELVCKDGSAVNWREFQSGANEILVKTVGSGAFLARSCFLHAKALS